MMKKADGGDKCMDDIEIYNSKNQSEHSTARIFDTCNDCEKYDIHVSQNVLEVFTPDAEGKRKVRWEPAKNESCHNPGVANHFCRQFE